MSVTFQTTQLSLFMNLIFHVDATTKELCVIMKWNITNLVLMASQESYVLVQLNIIQVGRNCNAHLLWLVTEN